MTLATTLSGILALVLLAPVPAPTPAPTSLPKKVVAPAFECVVKGCRDNKGALHGKIVLRWPDGSKWREGKFEAGTPVGLWVFYWPNGEKMAKISYAGGKPSGPATFWGEDGSVKAAGTFTRPKGTKGTVFSRTDGGSMTRKQIRRREVQRTKLRRWSKNIQVAAKELRALADEPAPAGLSEKERQAYDEQSGWLRSTADQLKGVASVGLQVAGGTVPGASIISNAIGGTGVLGGTGGTFGGASMVSEMAAMYMQFLALQQAIQNESRRYQTMSNAQRARHEVAMNSIRNAKA